jgi:hypothetical protein
MGGIPHEQPQQPARLWGPLLRTPHLSFPGVGKIADTEIG